MNARIIRGFAAHQQVRLLEYRKLAQNLRQVFLADLARSAGGSSAVSQATDWHWTSCRLMTFDAASNCSVTS